MSTFTLSENQVMLAESARKYVERGYGTAVRAASVAHAHGCSAQRWAEFAEMGWLALPLPEADDGLGGERGRSGEAENGQGEGGLLHGVSEVKR